MQIFSSVGGKGTTFTLNNKPNSNAKAVSRKIGNMVSFTAFSTCPIYYGFDNVSVPF